MNHDYFNSDIERSQRAFMAAAERQCCDHKCGEGRDCPNEQPGIGWLTVAIYATSAVVAIFVIGSAAVGLRWMIG